MFTLFPSIVLAAVPPFDINAIPQPAGSPYKTLGDLLSTQNGIGLITPVALIFFATGLFFLINILLAGFALMTSAGNPQGIEAARVRITNSIVGLLLVFTAYFIVQIVGTVLNLPGITGEFTG